MKKTIFGLLILAGAAFGITPAPVLTPDSVKAGSGISVSVGASLKSVTISTAGGAGVTSVTGTAPIVSSGGTTPAISLNKGGTGTSGCIFYDSASAKLGCKAPTGTGAPMLAASPTTTGTITGAIANWSGVQSVFAEFLPSFTGLSQPMTAVAPATASGRIYTVGGATNGGLGIMGLSSGDFPGTFIYGVIGTTSPSSTTPAIQMQVGKQSGTGIQSLASGDMALGIYNGATLLHSITGAGTSNFFAADARLNLTSTTGTNLVLFQAMNTGGTTYIGADNSTGAAFGAGNYASVFGTSGNNAVALLTNGTPKLVVSPAGVVTINNLASGCLTSASGVVTSSGAACATGTVTSSTLTAGTIPIATGAGAIGNSEITYAPNTFDFHGKNIYTTSTLNGGAIQNNALSFTVDASGNTSATSITANEINLGGAECLTAGYDGSNHSACAEDDGGSDTVATTITGTFTATLGGTAGEPTATFYYTKSGNQVVITIPEDITGTSDATNMQITGVPVGLQPPTILQIINCSVITTATTRVLGTAEVGVAGSGAAGTISFAAAITYGAVPDPDAWAASVVTKGIPPQTLTYNLQ